MPTPNTNAPIADPQTGRVTVEWLNFFQKLTGPAGPAVSITATGSPFTYTAPSAGTMVLNTAVNSLSLVRGRDPISLPAAPVLIPASPSLIPMAAGDRLLVTYTVTPTMTFLPS